jgi:hypothetical protein
LELWPARSISGGNYRVEVASEGILSILVLDSTKHGREGGRLSGDRTVTGSLANCPTLARPESQVNSFNTASLVLLENIEMPREIPKAVKNFNTVNQNRRSKNQELGF